MALAKPATIQVTKEKMKILFITTISVALLSFGLFFTIHGAIAEVVMHIATNTTTMFGSVAAELSVLFGAFSFGIGIWATVYSVSALFEARRK